MGGGRELERRKWKEELIPDQYEPCQEEDQSDHPELGLIVDIQYFPEQDLKTYNVHRKTGDFVIGEAGKIDVNNGQTFEVTLCSCVPNNN